MAAFDWTKIKTAQVTGRGRYLKDGSYKLIIQKMYTIKTRAKGLAFIADFIVGESDNDEIREGEKRNWYQSLTDEDIGVGAIKEFMLAACNIDQGNREELAEFESNLDELMEKVSDAAWRTAPAEDHPMHGYGIAAECFTKKTKKDADFTVHVWSPWEIDSEG